MATWRPQAEDLERIFDEQNPWHRTGEVPAALAPPVERPLASALWKRIVYDEPHRFQVVLGPRRVGKSTAMYQTVRHKLANGYDPRRLWWLRLDHPLLLRESLGDLVRAVLDRPPAGGHDTILFLDELVYAQEWDLWLKTFYDDRWPVRIVATSSATAALADRRLESGVGRWSEQFLTPYSFTEFLDFLSVDAGLEPASALSETLARASTLRLDSGSLAELRLRLLLVGGFPELLLQERTAEAGDNSTRLLQSQQVLRADAVERAIYKDIPQSFGIDNPMLLERLLYVLAGQVAGLLSPAGICRELDGLSTPTLDRYLSYLERAFMVFTLPNYSGSEASVQKRGRKLYFADGAVRNAALQRGLAPLRNPAELGLLTENLAAANLKALAVQADVRLFHWRDGKAEVDLIYDHPDEPLAFEIALSADHSRKGLQALMTRHPRFRGGCWLVAPDASWISPGRAASGVGTVSLDAFLIAVGRQAEAALRSRLASPMEPASLF